MKLKDYVKCHLYNAHGWSTKRKLVVIESDDWGSQRIVSREIKLQLQEKNLLKSNVYNNNDSLETATDLDNLCNVLSSVRNADGISPVFTANFIMQNPDYQKIKDHDYRLFFGEDFTDSYLRLQRQSNTKARVDQAINEKLMYPQFHGLLHLQRLRWLKDLQQNNDKVRKAFELEFYGFGKNEIDKRGYLAAFDADKDQDLTEIAKDLTDGVKKFEECFNFYPQTVIPPQNTCHFKLKKVFEELNFKGIQGARVVKMYPLKKGERDRKKRFSGIDKETGLVNLVRNVTFEPSTKGVNWVEKAFKEIEIAFQWNRPAIICSHRVNYISGINPENGSYSLSQLNILLRKIVHKFPNVEFISSRDLVEIIKK
jgi:hypothetical protein